MKRYQDLSGDGGSNVVGQIGAQRARIAGRLSNIKHLVGVGSGKGGVGKSTLSMQLALAFCEQGLRVGILDADFNGPCIAKLSGLRQTAMFPGVDGLLVPKTEDGISVLSLGSCLAEAEPLEFASIAPKDRFVWRSVREFSALADLLERSNWGALDVLLIDLPPGPERTAHFVEFFGNELNLVLTTVPSDVSWDVVLRGLSVLAEAESTTLGYVENMKGYLCPKSGEVLPLFPEKTREVGIPCLGSLPFEPALALACDSGLGLEQWKGLKSSALVNTIAESILASMEVRDEVSMCSL